MNTLADQIAPSRPFPGIASYAYRDREIFFGRDVEARRLFRLVSLYKGVMLFGDSGVGKSSLLNAAALPEAVAEGFTPILIRVRPELGQELVLQPVVDDEGVERRILTLPQVEETNVSCEQLLAILRSPSDVGEDVYPLFIFDQLEELVTLFNPPGADVGNATDPREIQREIVALVHTLLTDDNLHVKVVLSFREDYLAKIRSWFASVPFLDEHYLRVESISSDPDVLHDLARAPFERYPERFGNRIDDDLAWEVAADFQQRYRGGPVGLSELQIVCDALFASDSPTADFEALGSGGIIERYYTRALHGLDAEHQAIAVEILDRLVTPAGTRNIVSRSDLVAELTEDARVPEQAVLEALEELHSRARLVSRERRHDVEFYEVISEYLIPWILRQVSVQVSAQEVEAMRLDLVQGVRAEVNRYEAVRSRHGVGGIALSAAVVIGLVLPIVTLWLDGAVEFALGLLLVPVVVVYTAWLLYRRAARRAARAETLFQDANRSLLTAHPRTQEDLNNLRSDFVWRYVPLRVNEHNAAAGRHLGLAGLDATAQEPAAKQWADPDLGAELLSMPDAELEHYRRRARRWRWFGFALNPVLVLWLALAVLTEGEDDRQPWSGLAVALFYVWLIGGVLWLTLGRKARRRSKNAASLYAEAESYVTTSYPTTPEEVRAVRYEVRRRFEPLPVDTPLVVSAPAEQSAAPNWYPDPMGEADLRYWDGSLWTGYTHDYGADQLSGAEPRAGSGAGES